jgi:hypothetical protein
MKDKLIAFFLVLFLNSLAVGQSFEERLSAKLALYYQNNYPLQVELTFNQPKYVQGDTAYFAIRILTPGDFKTIPGKQVLQLDLFDADGKIVHHQKVLVLEGSGSNQFVVPVNITPGFYTVQAYCDRFQGSDPGLFYYGQLLIGGKNEIERKDNAGDIKFYPEGGRLVSNVSNRVIARGKPNSLGAVYDQDNNQIAAISLNRNGIQYLYLNPKPGVTYNAKIAGTTVELPKSEDGIAMVLALTRREFPFRITMQVSDKSSYRSENLFLVISAHGIVYYSAKVQFKDRLTSIASVPQKDFPDGLMRATIFTEDGTAIAERLFACERGEVIYANVLLDKDQYNVREKIIVNFKLTNERGTAVAGIQSCSIINTDLLKTPSSTPDLSPDKKITGNLAYAAMCEEADIFNDLTDRDLFLITQKWRWYSWADVWNEARSKYFLDGYLRFKGTATIDGQPVPDSTKIHFFMQNYVMTYEAYATNEGNFNIPLLIYFDDTEEIFYAATYNGHRLKNVSVVFSTNENKFIQCVDFVNASRTDAYWQFQNSKNQIDLSYRVSNAASKVKIKESPNSKFEEEIFGADNSYLLSDYKLLPTMAETLLEIVHFVTHRVTKGKNVVRVFYDETDLFAPGDPLFIIDGVITDDTDYFMSLNPESVQSIKVVHSAKKLWTFGKLGENGVILVETKIPNNARNVRRLSQPLKMTGLTKKIPFSSTHHGDAHLNFRVPDLRTSLYWNGEVVINKNGEAQISFYAPDNTGHYAIWIEGVTTDGVPYTATKTFEVVFKKEIN